MLVVLGFAVLVLAVGVVVLFAMLGELSTRVAQGGLVERSTVVQPLETARLGHAPASWPPALRHLRDGDSALLVLSSACSSCSDVARQVTGSPGHGDWPGMAVLVSSSDARAGEEFVAEHGLAEVAHYVDERGVWVAGEFDVRQSPAALIFRQGQLAGLYSFHDVAALRATVAGAALGGARETQEAGIR